MKIITYDQWVKEYGLIQNHLTEETSYNNTLFETYGDDLAFVNHTDINKVWTLISEDNEESWIIPGYHFLNRMGYFITEIPYENLDIAVNDNEMISVEYAKLEWVKLLNDLDIKFSLNDLSDFFSSNVRNIYDGNITVGNAKYLFIDFLDTFLDDDVVEGFEDEIHNHFSSL